MKNIELGMFVILILSSVTSYATETTILKAYSCMYNGKKSIIYPTADRLNRQSYDSDGMNNGLPGWMLSKVDEAQVDGAQIKIKLSNDYAGLGNFRKGEIVINETTGVGSIKLVNYHKYQTQTPYEFALTDCKSIRYRFARAASDTKWRLEKPYDWSKSTEPDDTGVSGNPR